MHLMTQNRAVSQVFFLLLSVSFLSYTLEVSFIFISWSFPTQFGVHFQFFTNCRALMVGLYLFTYYALQWMTALRNLTSYLDIILIVFIFTILFSSIFAKSIFFMKIYMTTLTQRNAVSHIIS